MKFKEWLKQKGKELMTPYPREEIDTIKIENDLMEIRDIAVKNELRDVKNYIDRNIRKFLNKKDFDSLAMIRRHLSQIQRNILSRKEKSKFRLLYVKVSKLIKYVDEVSVSAIETGEVFGDKGFF